MTRKCPTAGLQILRTEHWLSNQHQEYIQDQAVCNEGLNPVLQLVFLCFSTTLYYLDAVSHCYDSVEHSLENKKRLLSQNYKRCSHGIKILFLWSWMNEIIMLIQKNENLWDYYLIDSCNCLVNNFPLREIKVRTNILNTVKQTNYTWIHYFMFKCAELCQPFCVSMKSWSYSSQLPMNERLFQ